jgi:hypothetical protein
MEQFYKISIQDRHEEDKDQQVSMYVNGLEFNLRISLHDICSVEQGYSLLLKVEGKSMHKANRKILGKGRGTILHRRWKMHIMRSLRRHEISVIERGCGKAKKSKEEE